MGHPKTLHSGFKQGLSRHSHSRVRDTLTQTQHQIPGARTRGTHILACLCRATTAMRIRLGVGPGDGNHADVGVEPERVPDGLGRVDDVVLCSRGGSRTRRRPGPPRSARSACC
jgi:hypothetical protein